MLTVLAGKLEAQRSDCAPLAGKSTLNRLELSRDEPTRYNKVSHDPGAIESLFVELFLEAHQKAPKQIILDLDATDDLLHGNQEGRFFHGYYDCYCYLPLYIFLWPAPAGGRSCAARTRTARRAQWKRLPASWRRSAVAAGRGRAFCCAAIPGFTRDALMAWCEANRVDYVFPAWPAMTGWRRRSSRS